MKFENFNLSLVALIESFKFFGIVALIGVSEAIFFWNTICEEPLNESESVMLMFSGP